MMSGARDVLYPAGCYLRTLVVSISQLIRAVSTSDVVYMTSENITGGEYMTLRVHGILSPVTLAGLWQTFKTSLQSALLTGSRPSQSYPVLHCRPNQNMALRILSSCELILCAIGQVSTHSVSSRQSTEKQTSPYTNAVSKYVNSISETLWPINTAIHENPELQYEEFKAHDLLTSFLESQDSWNVTRSVYNISTAFTAVFQGNGDGPVVSFNAEYSER